MSKTGWYFAAAVAWFSLAIWPVAYFAHMALMNSGAWWGFPSYLLPVIAYLGVIIFLIIRGMENS